MKGGTLLKVPQDKESWRALFVDPRNGAWHLEVLKINGNGLF